MISHCGTVAKHSIPFKGLLNVGFRKCLQTKVFQAVRCLVKQAPAMHPVEEAAYIVSAAPIPYER